MGFSVNILKTAHIDQWDSDTKKVKNAFKKTQTLHTLPIKQFQPMHSVQMFGDPAPGSKKKVLTIIYTSTAITEKTGLSALFDNMRDSVAFGKQVDDVKNDDF